MVSESARFDVCIICAKPEEAEAFLDVAKRQFGVLFERGVGKYGKYVYRHTILKNKKGEDLTILVSWLPSYGSLETGLLLKTILEEFRPRFTAMTGICAGNKKRVALGDLIVAKSAFFYESGKTILNKNGVPEQLQQIHPWHINQNILQFLGMFQEWEPVAKVLLPKPYSKRHQRAWLMNKLLNPDTLSVEDISLDELEHYAPDWRKIVPELQTGPKPFMTKRKTLTSRARKEASSSEKEAFSFRDRENPAFHIGVMASSHSVRRDNPFGRFSSLERETIAIDMEGAAFYRTLADFPDVQGWLVKGVSDYADEDKDDLYHHYASALSALYVLCFLQEYVTTDLMPPIILSSSTDQEVSRPFWNVPRRNLLFTGRERFLEQLYRELHQSTSSKQALCGLGGIGKTQIAVEYAYRYRYHYQYIFWMNAAAYETLLADFVSLADFLHISEKDQNAIPTVKTWLESHSGWLLVFDNVDDLIMVDKFFPNEGEGHIVLTTRHQATRPIAQSIPLKKMDEEEGIAFLFKRIQEVTITPSPESLAEKEIAREIVLTLDGLPLALDQAGAYIEGTMCGMATYLERYREHQAIMLDLRGDLSLDHPDPVGTTWSLSFERVRREDPIAANILQLCAFLSPDEIPEEIFLQQGTDPGPPFQQVVTSSVLFDNAIAKLGKYSLIERNKHGLSIHRLVQFVLRQSMERFQQHLWAERAVQIIHRIFPEPQHNNWDLCRRYLSHATNCSMLIKEYDLCSEEAAQLLCRVGSYLKDLSVYSEAKSFCQQALEIAERKMGKDDFALKKYLDELAHVFFIQREIGKAEELMIRALALSEQSLGLNHSDIAKIFDNLGVLHYVQARYPQAEKRYLQALTIREKVLDPQHPDIGQNLNNLAVLYHAQDQFDRAEPLYRRAYLINKKQFGLDHPITAMSLDSLGHILYAQKKYRRAEVLYRKALSIREKVLGPEHHHMAHSLYSLGKLYQDLGQYILAEGFYQRAIEITEKSLGPEHPDTATRLDSLAKLYHSQKKYKEAEVLFLKSLSIQKKEPGSSHPNMALTLANLAELYQDQLQYQRAEMFYRQALVLVKKKFGSEHLRTRAIQEKYATLQEDMRSY